MAHPIAVNRFGYRWGGTSRLEAALRALNDRVEKSLMPDGARVLVAGSATSSPVVAGSATSVEDPSPFPVSADVTVEHEQQEVIAAICAQFGLKSVGAVRYVTTYSGSASPRVRGRQG